MRHQYDDDDDDEYAVRPTTVSGNAAGALGQGVATSQGRARATSPPWMPPGTRPGSQGGPDRAAIAKRVTASSTRSGRNVEHTHIFLDDPEKPATHPTNFFWVYASYEYKMQTTPDQARQVVFKMIEKLMDRVIRAGNSGGALDDENEATQRAHPAGAMLHAPPIGVDRYGEPRTAAAAAGGDKGAGNGVAEQGRAKVKAHLIFDLISTKKHITADFQTGHPYLLGQDIYRFVDKQYSPWIITSFVGLTDNTARRVGRDVYYSKTDDLSKTHVAFEAIDSEHLFIIFPPSTPPSDAAPPTAGPGGAATAGGGGLAKRNAGAAPTSTAVGPRRSPRSVRIGSPARVQSARR